MNFSDNLKKIRKQHNLSQEQIAEKLGVSRQSVSKWESGGAYPEMDKMLQLCQLFNLNIDDLLNQDIKEVNNNKQAKNNINKFIDDFLAFITKTIDMFSSMSFKQKVRCLFEQILVMGIISLVLFILSSIILTIFRNIFSFVPFYILNPILQFITSVCLILSLLLGIVLVLHIFKVRYLDYYVIVKEDKVVEQEEDNKIFLEKKQQKIVIRDPEHSGYKFISSLLKCLLFLIKIVIFFIASFFCLSLIVLVISVIVSLLFIKTGIMFLGTFILLISLIIINVVILKILYNFIISQKNHKTKLALCFLISLILFGVGGGLMLIGITKFDIIDNISLDNETTKTIEMNDNLAFIDNNLSIDYVESNDQDVKIVVNTSDYYLVDVVNHTDIYHFYYYSNSSKIMDLIRKQIKNINDKKIVDYSSYDITIYTSKENIIKLQDNAHTYYYNY